MKTLISVSIVSVCFIMLMSLNHNIKNNLSYYESWSKDLNESSGVKILFKDMPDEHLAECLDDNSVAVNIKHWKNKKFTQQSTTELLTLVLDCPLDDSKIASEAYREGASQDQAYPTSFCVETEEKRPCHP